MKKIVTVQDISCVGRCSLTVALPIISAMGVETSVLPTAVLSTQTVFKNFTFHDLTDEIESISAHWRSMGLTFDGIYTGYLGSFKQLELMSEFVDEFRGNGILLVDPVMGDGGKFHSGFTPDFAKGMAQLCGKADIIVPNLTEASLLLDVPYIGENYSEDYIKDMLRGLTALGAKKAVITTVSFRPGELGAMAYDSESNEFYSCFGPKIDGHYHGTGDIFTSAFMGAVMNELSLGEALRIAVDYTCECIRLTADDPRDKAFGVNFEKAIPMLIRSIGK